VKCQAANTLRPRSKRAAAKANETAMAKTSLL